MNNLTDEELKNIMEWGLNGVQLEEIRIRLMRRYKKEISIEKLIMVIKNE